MRDSFLFCARLCQCAEKSQGCPSQHANMQKLLSNVVAVAPAVRPSLLWRSSSGAQQVTARDVCGHMVAKLDERVLCSFAKKYRTLDEHQTPP